MGYFQDLHLGLTNLERTVDDARVRLEISRVTMIAVESVGKRPLQCRKRLRAGMDRQGGLRTQREPSQLVESSYMIHVRVRIKHCVERSNSLTKTLHSKIWSGIHHPLRLRGLNTD